MNHEEAWNLLNDYVDHDLPERRAAEVEAHLRECETCRHEVEQLRAVIDGAGALPRAIAPERDLWTGISTRIRPERATVSGVFGRFRKLLEPWPRWWPAVIPAAAVLLLVVVLGDRGPSSRGPVSDVAEGPGPDPVPTVVIGALEAESRQGNLELAQYAERAGGIENIPILGLIVENVRIIDRSITELKDVWEANPDSPRAARMLAAAYQAKMMLLGRASRLAAEAQT